jgi:hypothetical protein
MIAVKSKWHAAWGPPFTAVLQKRWPGVTAGVFTVVSDCHREDGWMETSAKRWKILGRERLPLRPGSHVKLGVTPLRTFCAERGGVPRYESVVSGAWLPGGASTSTWWVQVTTAEHDEPSQ